MSKKMDHLRDARKKSSKIKQLEEQAAKEIISSEEDSDMSISFSALSR